MLHNDGFQVAIVNSEQQALRLCNKTGYSYKIIDVGYQVYIRRTTAQANVPK